MADFFDVIQWHQSRNGKNFPKSIGSATPTKDGGFYVTLLALPIPQMREGRLEVQITIQPKREYQDSRARSDARDDMRRDARNDDDEIPF